MTLSLCPICARTFDRSPSHLRRARVSYCSRACRDAAWDDLGRQFDPGPAVGMHDAWIDEWRKDRMRLEREWAT